ncbi:MAG: alternative ribosome rescue aminoacyl-tRNA hydrolase ArfB [Crocinitomicaceae bacterium]
MIHLLKYRRDELIGELQFETSRSGGKGGQHANKTETRVTAVLNIHQSNVLEEKEKNRILNQLKNRIKQGVLRVTAEDSRSQSMNKAIAIDRMIALLEETLKIPKKRKPTKISRAKKEARLQEKKKHKEKKKFRKNPRKEDF